MPITPAVELVEVARTLSSYSAIYGIKLSAGFREKLANASVKMNSDSWDMATEQDLAAAVEESMVLNNRPTLEALRSGLENARPQSRLKHGLVYGGILTWAIALLVCIVPLTAYFEQVKNGINNIQEMTKTNVLEIAQKHEADLRGRTKDKKDDDIVNENTAKFRTFASRASLEQSQTLMLVALTDTNRWVRLVAGFLPDERPLTNLLLNIQQQASIPAPSSSTPPAAATGAVNPPVVTPPAVGASTAAPPADAPDVPPSPTPVASGTPPATPPAPQPPPGPPGVASSGAPPATTPAPPPPTSVTSGIPPATPPAPPLPAGPPPDTTSSEDDARLVFQVFSFADSIRFQARALEPISMLIGGSVLPLLFGFLGASVYLLRSGLSQATGAALPRNIVASAVLRIGLGGVAGLAIGWFQTDTAKLTTTPFAIAFLAGFSIELLFSLLDRIVTAIGSSPPPK